MKDEIYATALLLIANVFIGLTTEWMFKHDLVFSGLVIAIVLLVFDYKAIKFIWSNKND